MPDDPFPSPYPDEPKPRDAEVPKKIPDKPFVFPAEESVYAVPVVPVESIEMPAPEEDDEEVKRAVKKSCAIVVVVAILLFVVGNTVWNLSSRQGGDVVIVDENEEEETPVDPDLVLAAKGGTVSLGKVELIIPPGALAHDEKIEIEKVADGEVTDLYYFKPHGLKFLKRITVVLPYKEEGLKGASPYSIELDYWPKEKLGSPRSIGYTVDEKEKTLQTHVSEF